MKSLYFVYGWLNGSDYDADGEPDATVEVVARDERDAEDKGEAKIKKLIGTCDVIAADKI